MTQRRSVVFGLAGLMALPVLPFRATAQGTGLAAGEVIDTWHRLILELVRHTATYSPPVAARAFAYVGVTLYEAMAARPESGLKTLAGQVNGLTPLPAAAAGLDEAAVAHGALCKAVNSFFANTGPTGQRAMVALQKQMQDRLAETLTPDAISAAVLHGEAVFAHILDWSATDGGATVENMGFPMEWQANTEAGHWVPTNLIRQQQAPLLPNWGQNRTFCMENGAAAALAPPVDYSEDPASEFFKQAQEVYDISKSLTDEQKVIARFWSDDPMLTQTPPGHWVFIALDLLNLENANADRRAEVLALVGMAVADGFIACWHQKFVYDTIRPITYIKAHIDKAWEPLLNTPPFPEYPSGHSTQSGAAQVVFDRLFGADFAFDDACHEDEGFEVRHFPDFRAAADEAGISRLYGGIHFRAAVENGLEQGRAVGAYVAKLQTRKTA